MERYLMTHSLLASWLYAIRENPYETAESEAKKELSSYDEFMLTLERKPTPTNEAMQKGIDFEVLVTNIIKGQGNKKISWYEAAEQVAGIVRGGLLQYRAHKAFIVSDMSLLLYGRLDALRAGVVYDIKFSGQYKAGKYISSTQHPMYMELVPEAKQFTYLVSNGSSVWPETYTREETPSIFPIITDFFNWLDVRDLMNTYKKHWLAL